jgi:hypothetical protein
MTTAPGPDANPTHPIKPGPEIVSEFIEELKNDGSLDKDVVAAIETLSKDNKLNALNLQKALTELRGPLNI